MTDLLWQRIEQSLAAQTMMRTLGVRLHQVAAGEVWLAAPILASSRQQQGAGAGALTFALGDTAAGYAALSQIWKKPARTHAIPLFLTLRRPGGCLPVCPLKTLTFVLRN